MKLSVVLVRLALATSALSGCTMTLDEFNRSFRPPVGPVERPAGADTKEERAKAADRYLDTIDFAEYYEEMLREVAKTLPDAKRAQFFELAKKAMPLDYTRRETHRIWMENFTAQELDDLTHFYGSPEGRVLLSKDLRRSGPPAPPEDAFDTPEDRRIAAQRLMMAVDFRQVYGEQVRGIYSSLPSGADERFLKLAHDGYGRRRQEELDRISKYYTRREIDRLIRFYGTPTGQASLRNESRVKAETMRFVLEVLSKAGITH